jgi:hypothetical protein
MTADDFYRILSRVRGMQWAIVQNAKQQFGVPSSTTFIQGVRFSLWYSPLSAVATCVRRKFVDVSNPHIPRILHLDPRTYRRIHDATYQRPGYSKAVRRKLTRACDSRPF